MKCFRGLGKRRLLTAIFCVMSAAVLASNICLVCKEEISGSVYVGTDQVTGEKGLLCSNCLMLARCFLCGLPVKTNLSTTLADGRILCARDAKTVVLDVAETRRIAEGILDDLNRNFMRFMEFPTNVNVDVIDRNDELQLFHKTGFDFESPNLLGCLRQAPNYVDFWMRLMTGQTPAGLKATCAHEFTHAWCRYYTAGDRSVPVARDAEEGFCELIAYLLMDAKGEEAQKKVILANYYTRGQVHLFIEAEKRYGLDQVLDWMRYGNTDKLEAGKLDAIRNITPPPPPPRPFTFGTNQTRLHPVRTNLPVAPAPVKIGFRLEGINLGRTPLASINGHTFAVGETAKVKMGGTNMVIQCLAIKKASARIREMESGTEYELHLP